MWVIPEEIYGFDNNPSVISFETTSCKVDDFFSHFNRAIWFFKDKPIKKIKVHITKANSASLDEGKQPIEYDRLFDTFSSLASLIITDILDLYYFYNDHMEVNNSFYMYQQKDTMLISYIITSNDDENPFSLKIQFDIGPKDGCSF